MSDSELAVLNILLKHPKLVYNNSVIKPFMFGSTTHSALYNAITELKEKNLIPERALLLEHLNSTSKLRDAGGVEYIDYILNLNYSEENLSAFERNIVDLYKVRQLKSLASHLQGEITPTSVDIAIESARKGLDSISLVSGAEQVFDMNSAGSDAWLELMERVENPGIRGVATGSKNLDVITGGYNEGDLWIIGGRPSQGKSAQMCNSALACAKSGKPVLIFTLEMSKSQIVERMLSIETGVSYSEIRLGALDKQQLNKLSTELLKFKDYPIYIDTNVSADDAYFASVTRKYHKDKGVRVSFFDYIQLGTERDSEQLHSLGKFSRTAKLLARDLGITSVLYSQLNRGVEQREDKHPVLSDLRQSGNLEEDADIVMFLYRDEYYYPNTTKQKGVMEYILAKNRNGPIGTTFSKFESSSLKISDKD
jgi:replicative DNA helicase